MPDESPPNGGTAKAGSNAYRSRRWVHLRTRSIAHPLSSAPPTRLIGLVVAEERRAAGRGDGRTAHADDDGVMPYPSRPSVTVFPQFRNTSAHGRRRNSGPAPGVHGRRPLTSQGQRAGSPAQRKPQFQVSTVSGDCQSPKSRQNDHRHDKMNTKAQPGQGRGPSLCAQHRVATIINRCVRQHLPG